MRRDGLGAEALRYLLAGGSAWIVDAGLYAALLQAGLHYLPAASAGFAAGLVVAYALSVRWVFGQRRHAERQRLEFGLFVLTGLWGWALTLALLWALIDHAGVSPLPAKVLSAGLVLCSNFAMRRWLLFSAPARAH